MSVCFCGADIIDFCDSFNIKSFSNPAYLNKVFHQSELDYIQTVNDKLKGAFLLWACKEATYKMCCKMFDRSFTFVPKQFLVTKVISPNKENMHSVCFRNKSYPNTVVSTNQYLFAYCHSQSELLPSEYIFDYAVLFDTDLNQGNNSEKCRDFIRNELKRKYHNIGLIEKEINGIFLPSLTNDFRSQKTGDISISHDGNYLAYSLMIFTNFTNNGEPLSLIKGSSY